jgi:site-specific recombinase XerD
MARAQRSPSNKGQKYPVEVLTDDEMKRLIRACSNRAPTGVRNRAMVALLYRGGLRIAEALSLRMKDVDADDGTVRVLRGKGRKARTIGLDPGAMALVQRWTETRAKRGINSRAPLICTLTGTPVQPAYVRALMPRLALKAGINKRVHPHALRHAHAAQLAAEGVAINIIQKQLGHTNAATTSRYLDHIAPREVIETMKKREWGL